MTHKTTILGQASGRYSGMGHHPYDLGAIRGSGNRSADVYVPAHHAGAPVTPFGFVNPFGIPQLRNPLLFMIQTDMASIGLPKYDWLMSDVWDLMKDIDLDPEARPLRGVSDSGEGIELVGSALRLFPSTASPLDWGWMKRYDNMGPCPVDVPSLGVEF